MDAAKEVRADSPMCAVLVAGLTDDQKDSHQKAKDAGWAEKTAFDYQLYQDSNRDGCQWAATGQIYDVEWKDEYGDVGPEVPELEKILFMNGLRSRKGEFFKNLELDVRVEGPDGSNQRIRKFEEAGLHPVMMSNLKLAQYEAPTPIQSYTIPNVMKGLDIVAVAQTGSGKTAAYLIPIMSKLMGKAKKLAAPRPATRGKTFDARIHGVRAEPLVVIVVPTRELAIQIFDETRAFCYRTMLRPCVVYGGLPTGITRDQLGGGCDILIATPGRLCDLMDKPHILTMSRVKFTVIDEADEMLNQDWSEEVSKIMAGGDSNEDADHVFMMFSATFPKEARMLAREYMTEDYVRIRVGRAGQAHKNIRQTIVYVEQDKKKDACLDLLMNVSEPVRTLIFCNSRPGVDLLDDFLYNRGLPTTSIHSERGQMEREDAMNAFRDGSTPILIATGVSARGWDIKDVKHVINYDLPSARYGGLSEYIHRIGRTARIGHQGLATSFYNSRNEEIAQDLVNTLVECDCEVPDFLQHLAPTAVEQINFDDDSDDDANDAAGGFGAGDGFGAVAGFGAATGFGDVADGAAATTGWAAADAVDNGFTADTGFTAEPATAGAAAW